MFIYYYTYARVPMNQIKALLVASNEGWATELFRTALEDDDLVKVRLSAGRKSNVSKNAWIQLGTPVEIADSVSIPIRIQGTGLPELFPTLEGEIELAPMGNELTQMTLRGNYKPPLGVIGRFANKTLLHRVAEGSIKRFLDGLACSIENGEESKGSQDKKRREPYLAMN